MENITFKELISKNRFDEAVQMIERGDDILKSQFQFKLSDAFANIIRKNAFKVLEALVAKDHIELDIFEYDDFKNTLFLALAKSPDTDEAVAFLENLVPQIDNVNDSLGDQTWLSLVLEEGMPARLVQTLIDQGCDPHYINNKEESLLHQVTGSKSRTVTPAQKLAAAQILIDQGIDVSRADISGRTPLHNAVASQQKEMVQLLLENGADANVAAKYSSAYPNQSGATPYHTAVLDLMDIEMVNLLASHAPVDFFVESPRKTSLLYDYVEQQHYPSVGDREQQFLQFFAENGADVFRQNEDVYGNQKTVLDVLVGKNFEFFDAFLQRLPFDVNQADDAGNTLLHKVCAFNVNFEEKKAKDLYRKVKLLIKMGADVSITNTQDKTPIDLAGDDNLKEKTVAIMLKQQ